MRIKNWEKHQHYKLKNPKGNPKMHWFKVYGGDVLNDMDYHLLNDQQKLCLFELWCLASQHNGNLPAIEVIAFRLRRSEKEVDDLIRAMDNWLDLEKVYTSSRVEKKRVEEKRVEEKRSALGEWR